MARSFRAMVLAGFAALLFAAAVGCKMEFVTDAARSSAASFVSSVFNTAVSEVIGGG